MATAASRVTVSGSHSALVIFQMSRTAPPREVSCGGRLDSRRSRRRRLSLVQGVWLAVAACAKLIKTQDIERADDGRTLMVFSCRAKKYDRRLSWKLELAESLQYRTWHYDNSQTMAQANSKLCHMLLMVKWFYH